jgi:hypothetical protein
VALFAFFATLRVLRDFSRPLAEPQNHIWSRKGVAIAIPKFNRANTERTPVVRRHARRVSVAVAGGTTIVVGLILIPLPGPGTLIVLAGLSILGREFPRARRAADRGKAWAGTAFDTARRGAGKLGDWFSTETDTVPPEE